MPELPEVETVVSDLNKKIKGYEIIGFWSAWTKALKGISLKKFQKEITGRQVIKVRRIGKNIFIDLSGEKTLYLHLKMTGHLLLKYQKNFQFPTGRQVSNFQTNSNNKISPPVATDRLKVKNGKIGNHPLPNPLPKGEGAEKEVDYFADRVNQYIRHKWMLKNGKEDLIMEFSDLRKFGKIVLVDTNKIGELPEIKKLGIDAMDKNFTLEKFKGILSRKNKSVIGIVLMDQHLIAGIGNIYRSEILFEAGVDPRRRVESLKNIEIERIFKQIKEILKKAIKMRGTSDSDYRDTFGKPGRFQELLKVYRREGQMCLVSQSLPKSKKCVNMVKRITLGQRSVFVCDNCQK